MIFWDSSAIVPLLADEPDSDRRVRLLSEDPVIVAWWGTAVECESSIQRRLREGMLSRTQARTAQNQLTKLAESWHEVPPSPVVRTLAVRLLRTHPLRAAEVLQLAAAFTLLAAGLRGLAFASADHRLKEAAEIEDLAVVGS